MAVNISDLLMCVEVDLTLYPAQHQQSKQWNNSVVEVKVTSQWQIKQLLPWKHEHVHLNKAWQVESSWLVAGLLATAQPFTWARLIYGRLTRSLFKKMCAPKSPCFCPSKLFSLQGISAFGLGEQDCPCFFWARLWQVDHHNIISYRSCWCGF